MAHKIQKAPSQNTLLGPYRVLDLSDEGGLLCGRMLADLGADVIQIEPPGGSPARRLGPFYKDQPHPEGSLFWWAYASNKRGITLNIETADGQAILKRLAKEASFLIESFEPGHLGSLGLGYEALSALNPGLIMASITPFGQEGPLAHYKAPDIVGMAMGGFMYLTGDPDRPPVRPGFPQFYLHGAAAAAVGALIAHHHRTVTGQGQHVDVSCQQAVARTLAHAPQSWDLERVVLRRLGTWRMTSGKTLMPINWRCQDGYVNFLPMGGTGIAQSTRALLQWMDEEGVADPVLKEIPWESIDYGRGEPELMERIVPPLERFFLSHTKGELTQESLKRRIFLFPVATPKDILQDSQLKARDYFRELPHPELEVPITHLGPFVKAEGDPVSLRRRAPRIGEHNEEVYSGELGLSAEELVTLRQAGVV